MSKWTSSRRPRRLESFRARVVVSFDVDCEQGALSIIAFYRCMAIVPLARMRKLISADMCAFLSELLDCYSCFLVSVNPFRSWPCQDTQNAIAPKACLHCDDLLITGTLRDCLKLGSHLCVVDSHYMCSSNWGSALS